MRLSPAHVSALARMLPAMAESPPSDGGRLAACSHGTLSKGMIFRQSVNGYTQVISAERKLAGTNEGRFALPEKIVQDKLRDA
jgi:hypothetical protein